MKHLALEKSSVRDQPKLLRLLIPIDPLCSIEAALRRPGQRRKVVAAVVEAPGDLADIFVGELLASILLEGNRLPVAFQAAAVPTRVPSRLYFPRQGTGRQEALARAEPLAN